MNQNLRAVKSVIGDTDAQMLLNHLKNVLLAISVQQRDKLPVLSVHQDTTPSFQHSHPAKLVLQEVAALSEIAHQWHVMKGSILQQLQQSVSPALLEKSVQVLLLHL